VDDAVGYDVADQDPDPMPDINNGCTHGTHCVGIAGAVSDNSRGLASVGYDLSIICINTAPNNASDESLPEAWAGVQYAIAAGAYVISMSWGGGSGGTFAQGVINAAVAHGAVCLAAMGNDGLAMIQYPSGYNGVIGVGATASNDAMAVFSNYGGAVDVMAPGVNINSTVATGSANQYGRLSGTSIACPMAAGLCALMLSYNPNLTPDILEAALKAGCVNIDAQNSQYIGQMGAGRINAGNAIRAARPSQCAPTTVFPPMNSAPGLVTDSLTGTYPAGNHDAAATPAQAKAQIFSNYTGYNLLRGYNILFAKATLLILPIPCVWLCTVQTTVSGCPPTPFWLIPPCQSVK